MCFYREKQRQRIKGKKNGQRLRHSSHELTTQDNHEQLRSTSWWSDVGNMEIKQFTGISLGNRAKACAWLCGLRCKTLREGLWDTPPSPKTYWQWCSWSFPCPIRYMYSPRSFHPWVSRRFLPQCKTAGWSYRSTFPLLQREKTYLEGVMWRCRNAENDAIRVKNTRTNLQACSCIWCRRHRGTCRPECCPNTSVPTGHWQRRVGHSLCNHLAGGKK